MFNLWWFSELGEVWARCAPFKTDQEAHHVSQLDIPGIARLESHLGAVHLPHVVVRLPSASSTDNNPTTEDQPFQGHNSFTDHQEGRDCIPTTGCAAIIHNTEPQPRTNNEGLCRNVSPSTYPCQWVSQWVIDSFRFWRWLSHLQGLQASFCLFLNSQFLKVKVKCLIKTGIVGILLGS